MRICLLFSLLLTYTYTMKESYQESSPSIDETEEQLLINFDQTIGGLISSIDQKVVIKPQEQIIEHLEAISRNKFLTDTLTSDMKELKNNSLISDPKAGKLYAILQNIEAIENHIKMTKHYESEANRYCTIVFKEYDYLIQQDNNGQINGISFLSKYIDNFTHVNFKQIPNTGVFLTKELSREGNLTLDFQRVQFTLNNLNKVMVSEKDSSLLKKGSFGSIYALPDDTKIDNNKKVIKAMTFKNLFYEEFLEMIDSGKPLLDILLFVVENKRSYFEQVYKEIKINAKLNQFKVIDNQVIDGNDPENNINSVNFYGCINYRMKDNYKMGNFPNVLKSLKDAYSKLIQTPSELRDLMYKDLIQMYNNKPIDLSIKGASNEVKLDETNKVAVIVGFLRALNVYQEYLFISIFERLDVDLFDKLFQTIYQLNMGNLELRFNMYNTIANKLKYLHDEGFNHCDVKTTNMLYDIIPKGNYFNLDYERFKIIDFGMVQGKSRFCQGGTIGYLAPEVENPLRLPRLSSEFMDILKNCEDINDEEYDDLNMTSYIAFKTSLSAVHEIKIPAEYVDLKVFFEDASISRPELMIDWIQLFHILSKIFEHLGMINIIEYVPRPQDIDVPSKKLKVVVDLPKIEKAAIIIDGQQVDFSKENIRKKLQESRQSYALKSGPKSHFTSGGHIRAMPNMSGAIKPMPIVNGALKVPQTQNENDSRVFTVEEKNEFHRRFQLRKGMMEGSLDYPRELIAPLNKADIFSLGMIFNEMETALNTKSIFNEFSEIPKEEYSLETLTHKLYEPIEAVFDMKNSDSTRLPGTIASKMQPYFKDSKDMNLSFNAYSSETKMVKRFCIAQFRQLHNDLKALILEMLSYYANDRPELDDVIERINQMNETLKELRSKFNRYKISMNSAQSKIKSAENNLLKLKYKEIYPGNLILI